MSTHASEKSRATWPRILRSRTRRIVALTTGLFLVAGVAAALYTTTAPITGTVTPGNPQNIAWAAGATTTSGSCVISSTAGDGTNGTSQAATGVLNVTWDGAKPGDVCEGFGLVRSQSNVTVALQVSDFIMTGLPTPGVTLAVKAGTFGTVLPVDHNSQQVFFRLTAGDDLSMGAVPYPITGHIYAIAATDPLGTSLTPTY